MSAGEAMSDKPTPRPWKITRHDFDTVQIADADNDEFIMMDCPSSDSDEEVAALIVQAVNSYDEARALLREAADVFGQFCDAIDDENDPVRGLSEDMFARIRAYLENAG